MKNIEFLIKNSIGNSRSQRVKSYYLILNPKLMRRTENTKGYFDISYPIDKMVNLTLVMVIETRVKYEKITYMKYFLEQVGIKFN